MPDYLTPLDADALTDQGIEGWPFGFADQVRFYELDALNHVNNVVFLRWFENIRVTYFLEYGLSSYGPDDPQIVVRRQTADYLAPMFQSESYLLTARTRLLKESSLIMEYAVHAGGTIKASGDAVIVSLEQDGKTRRAHDVAARARIIERDRPEIA